MYKGGSSLEMAAGCRFGNQSGSQHPGLDGEVSRSSWSHPAEDAEPTARVMEGIGIPHDSACQDPTIHCEWPSGCCTVRQLTTVLPGEKTRADAPSVIGSVRYGDFQTSVIPPEYHFPPSLPISSLDTSIG